MNTAVVNKFSVKPLAAAIALACSAGAAFAAPPPLTMPGSGTVIQVNDPANVFFTAPGYTIAGGAPIAGGKGATLINGFPGATISINNTAGGKAVGVLQWGGNGKIGETTNPDGFNIGSLSGISFTSGLVGGAVPASAILNIDSSGFPSQIYGQLSSFATGANPAPILFVSNASGIIQGPGVLSLIVLPNGGGLIGAKMNSSQVQIDDFVGNNSTGVSYIDIIDGQSPISINGNILGPLPGVPAGPMMIAGGNIVNAGNVYTDRLWLNAGMTESVTKATVNGFGGTPVQRFWNVFAQDAVSDFIGLGLGLPGGLQITVPTASVMNTGSFSVQNGPFVSLSAHGFQSGTPGNTDPTVGIFSDIQVLLVNYTTGSSVNLYNTVRGFSTNTTLPWLFINNDFIETPVPGAAGDVLIQANTIGTDPSSITTTNGVFITGENVTINSTINHKTSKQGGVNGAFDLDITGTKSVTVNASIGAGENVNITAKGPILVAAGATVLSDTDLSGDGGIFIVNNGTQANNSTTINGNLTTAATSGDEIEVLNNGISNSNITIGPAAVLTSNQSADVELFSRGNLFMNGTISAADDAFMTALGVSVGIMGPVTANVDPQALGNNGLFGLAAPIAQTKLGPAGIITAPTVLFGFDDSPFGFASNWVGVNNVQGVNAAGNRYASPAEKPATQIFTNAFVWMGFGSLSAPWGTNTNWSTQPQTNTGNGMQIDPLIPSVPVSMSLSAVGGGPQFVNLQTKGDIWVDSGATLTPFVFTTGIGGEGFGVPIGNGGSSLILNATNAMQVMSNSGAQGTWAGGPGFNTFNGFGNTFFEFPGGIALLAGSSYTQFVSMYNAWTALALPFQGIWIQSPSISTFGFYAIDGNARVNYSTMPVNGLTPVYTLQHPDPVNFLFTQQLDRSFINVYTSAINAGAINNCPIGFTC